jgi:hypothetical protein
MPLNVQFRASSFPRFVCIATDFDTLNKQGYGNDSVQNGPFGFLSRQVPSRRRRTEVRPMPKRLAISDLVSFSLR